MANAHRLGKGARLASIVYRKLPESWKMFELYQKLTGIAAQLLKEGKCDDDIVQALELQLYDWGYQKAISYPVIRHVKKKKIKLRTPGQCKKMEEGENRSLMSEVGERHKVQGTRKIRSKKYSGKISQERHKEKQMRNNECGIRNKEGGKKLKRWNCKLPTICISVSRLTFHLSQSSILYPETSIWQPTHD
ncbi:MAG: hypothetical protein QM731_22955 [Chitinophagaceae bacterium]